VTAIRLLIGALPRTRPEAEGRCHVGSPAARRRPER
jgi:hypothetical protein